MCLNETLKFYLANCYERQLRSHSPGDEYMCTDMKDKCHMNQEGIVEEIY